MDVPRKDARRNKLLRRAVLILMAVITVPLITVGMSRLKPAAPPVDRSSVLIDQVKRGPMLRNVRGIGTLIPEEILWIPAQTEGRVDKLVLRPGADVTPNSIILEISNPELSLAMLHTE